VLYVTALTPNGVTTPVSGSQGWYVDEPSGEPTNFGIQQVDSNVTDPSSAAAASLQQVVEGAADHVRRSSPSRHPSRRARFPAGFRPSPTANCSEGATRQPADRRLL